MSGLLIIAGRVIGLAAALFIGAFALDVFAVTAPWWQKLVGLAIHLIPSAVLVAFLLVSWRWPLAGGVLFLVAALAPFLLLSNTFWVNALLAASPALAGLLLVTGSLLQRAG